MAVTTLSQPLHDLWAARMPGVGSNPGATLRSGLVSDLAVGDFLIGSRATVFALGATAGGNRTLTLRNQTQTQFDVVWPTAATVWFTR